MSDIITFKVYFTHPSGKQEIRRFTTSTAGSILPSLHRFLEDVYSKFYQPPLRFLIQYDDGEDLLTVSSEAELQEGLSLHRASGDGTVWKILCRFDQTPLSGFASPSSGISGLSTPALAAALAEEIASPVAPLEEEVEAEFPPIPDDEAESAPLMVNAVESDGNASDDEYVRIDEDDDSAVPDLTMPHPDVASTPEVVEVTATPEPQAEVAPEEPVVEATIATPEPAVVETVSVSDLATQTVVAEQSTVPTQTESSSNSDSSSSAATQTVEAPADDESEALLSSLIHEVSVDRFQCRLCSKMFKGREFVVKHLRNRHSEKEMSAAPAVDSKTPVDAPVTSPQPTVEESLAAAFGSVEITDITGHHEHVDASPSPQPEPIISPPSPQPQAPVEPQQQPSASVRHHGITCDGCRQSPIVGVRYHCTACTMPGGFDLCERCEAAGNMHPQSHVLLKMRTPAHIAVGTAARLMHPFGGCLRVQPAAAASRPKAAFISDVTLADGLQVRAGEQLHKVWSIKNVGDAPWPHGTRLIVVGGDLAPESDRLLSPFAAAVPFAGPNDIVHVSIDIQVPNESGRFRATFRLETPDRVRFGPRVWVDLTVPEEAPVAAPQPQSQPLPKPTAPVVSPKPAPKQESPKAALPIAMPVSASSPPAGSAPSPSARKQTDAEKEEEQLAQAIAESRISAQSRSPLPLRPQSQPTARTFKYSNELATLRGMGFNDSALCQYLLLNNQGDVQKVVAWLLNHAA